MRESQPTVYLNVIKNALSSPKVDELSLLYYYADSRKKDFDPNNTKIGIIATVETKFASIDGTLSRSDHVLAVLTSYFNIPDIVKDPKVIKIKHCSSEIIELLQSNKSDEVELTTPWSGTVGDEWDSPSYDSFWGPVEREFQRKTDLLKSVGEKVKIVDSK